MHGAQRGEPVAHETAAGEGEDLRIGDLVRRMSVGMRVKEA